MVRNLILLICLCITIPASAQCDDWDVVGSNPINYVIDAALWNGAGFVAVADNVENTASVLLSSATGSPPWRHQFLHPGPISDIAFDGSTHMVCGSNGYLAVSQDLVNWEARNTGLTNTVVSVAGSNSFWTMVGNDAVYYSNDNGLSWSQVATGQGLNQVRWLGGRMVAVGRSGLIMQSSDGLNWISQDRGVRDFHTVTWNGSLYVVAGDSQFLDTSSDLVTWTKINVGFDAEIRASAWTGSQFILSTGTNFIHSPDGITWTPSNSNAPTGTQFHAIATNGPRTLALGDSGRVYETKDAVTWTSLEQVLTNIDLSVAATKGNTSIVFRKGASSYFMSQDAVNWQSESFGFGIFDNVYSADASDDMFLIGAGDGIVGISSDGLTWDVEAIGHFQNIVHVAVGNQNLMLVTADNRVYVRSHQSTIWEQRTSLPQSVNALVAGHSKFLTVGDFGTMYSSTDGLSWEEIPLPSGNHLHGITYSNNPNLSGYVAVGTESNILYSTDGVTWSRNNIGSASLHDAAAAGSRWLAVGDAEVLESVDAVNWTPVSQVTQFPLLRNVGWNGFNAFISGDRGLLLSTDCSSGCSEVNVSQQPQSQTVAAGESVTLSVVANGNEPINYQWQKNGDSLPGADSPQLVLQDVSLNDVAVYQCRISNDCSLVFSQVARIDLSGPPQVVQQPQPIEICAGGSAIFVIEATGSGDLGYQWNRDGVAIPGAVESQLTLNNISSNQAGTITCTVTNLQGNTTSNAAELIVASIPQITKEPADTVACVEGSATLSLTVQATGVVNYQWRRESVPLNGAVQAQLLLEDLDFTDAGNYDCVVSTQCGSRTSAPATLSISTQPQIMTQPSSTVTLCNGQDLTLSVNPDGVGPYTYQWFRDGISLPGAEAAQYQVVGVSDSDSGIYLCTLTNGCGSITTTPSVVTVSGTIQITGAPDGGVICGGQPLTLSAKIQDAAPEAYQWLKDGAVIEAATQADYQITQATPADSGSYTVLAVSECGILISESQSISVTTPVEITSHPNDTLICTSPVTLFAEYQGEGEAIYWEKDGNPLLNSSQTSLTIEPGSSASGIYRFMVFGSCGSIPSQPATVLYGFDNLAMTFDAAGQGYDPITLSFESPCDPAETEVTWIRAEDGTILAQDQSFLTVDPPPTQTTHYLVTVHNPGSNLTYQLTATILVPLNPTVQDTNGDGCNTVQDLYLAAGDWLTDLTNYDADDNLVIDIRDLLYVPISEEICIPIE